MAASFGHGAGPAALVAARSGTTLLAEDPAPPISLTASDGTGLVLSKLGVRAVVEGPLAFTELHLRFENPIDRQIEGRFAITLPDGAALSRFAMAQEKGWMEAEVVERMAARRAYEDFLHRRQDPALLENEAGNEFSARVFPIPARGHKDLIVSFSHEVRGAYVLPLRGLPAIGEVAASVRVARPDRAGPAFDEVTLAESGWKPDRDLAVGLGGAPTAIRAGDLIAVAIDPLADAAPAPLRAATILFDTSASRALGYAGQVENLLATVDELARAHGADLPIILAAFDQEVVELYRGPASGFASVKDKLMARTALGASDLAGALGWAAGHGATGRVIVVSDAVSTIGDPAKLGPAVAKLGPRVDRLDVVLVGGLRDRDAAAGLARAGLAHDGAVLDGARGPAEVARRLGLATSSGLAVEVDGARWVWPRTLDGVQPGDTAVVVAGFGKAAPARVTVRAGSGLAAVAPAEVPRPLLDRAAASARIAGLTAERTAATDAARRAELARKIVELSTRHRVLSDLTALLVLETEDDYARFNIPRTALTDILVVDDSGVALAHRAQPVLMARPEADKTATVDTKEKADLAKKNGAKDFGELEDEDGDMLAGPMEQKPEEPADQREMRDPESGQADGYVAAPPPPPAPRPAATMRPSSPARRPASRRPHRSRPSPDIEADLIGGDVGGAAGGAVAGLAGGVADGPSGSSDDKASGPSPWEGELAEIMALIERDRDRALRQALAWRARDPGDVLALITLGEVYEARKAPAQAARAYGSIIDLFPSRADLRRFAGERLERLGAAGRALAIDTYRSAVENRPDHLTGHRLLAWALAKDGDLEGAFAALERGLGRRYPDDRFRGGTRILREDLGIVAAAWIARAPDQRAAIEKRLARAGARVARDATLRFVLYWETDANDVDFHIRDARGGHAYYQSKRLRSGGELYEDITTGYGPECFTITGKPRAYPYQIQIHYYSRGPMGYGMGVLEIVRHDGKGNLAFDERPYVVMVDGAFVDLGKVDASTARVASGPTLAK